MAERTRTPVEWFRGWGRDCPQLMAYLACSDYASSKRLARRASGAMVVLLGMPAGGLVPCGGIGPSNARVCGIVMLNARQLVGLVAALAGASWLLTSCGPPTPTPTSQFAMDDSVLTALRAAQALEPTVASAEALYSEFEADPEAARIRYAQRTLSVTGVVESVGQQEGGHPLVTLATAGKWGVQCFPSDDKEARPSQRLVGTEATIQGSGVHWVWHVVVQDCRVMETYLPGVERPTPTPQSAQAASPTLPRATPFRLFESAPVPTATPFRVRLLEPVPTPTPFRLFELEPLPTATPFRIRLFEPVPTATPTRLFELSPTLAPLPLFSPSCCKYCSKGKACGDTCISRSYTCHVGLGCACNR